MILWLLIVTDGYEKPSYDSYQPSYDSKPSYPSYPAPSCKLRVAGSFSRCRTANSITAGLLSRPGTDGFFCFVDGKSYDYKPKDYGYSEYKAPSYGE